MDISYKSKKIAKQLSTVENRENAFGSLAVTISRRLKQIKDSTNLCTLKTLLTLNCRQLTPNPLATWIIDVQAGYCIFFELDHNPVPTTETGAVDTSKITQLRIITITRY